jgi:hypothetical protein
MYFLACVEYILLAGKKALNDIINHRLCYVKNVTKTGQNKSLINIHFNRNDQLISVLTISQRSKAKKTFVLSMLHHVPVQLSLRLSLI